MSMQKYEELKELLCRELDEITEKGELSAGSLETVHKLTDSIKNIDKIMMLEEDGYSQGGDWEARGMYGHHSYDEGGNSYRGRKRDSMGRYSRDDGRMYSRDGGEKENMIRKLREMMDGASGQEREIIRKCINKIENA